MINVAVGTQGFAFAGPSAAIALAFNGALVSLGQGVGAVLGATLTDLFGAGAMAPGIALIAGAG
jgi:hypothetical protein